METRIKNTVGAKKGMLCVSVLKCNTISENCHTNGKMLVICTYTRRMGRKNQEAFYSRMTAHLAGIR